jgi:hypothetical protein
LTNSDYFHRNPRWLQVLEALPNSAVCRSEAVFFDYFASIIQHAVMTPLVTHVDANGRRSNQHFLVDLFFASPAPCLLMPQSLVGTDLVVTQPIASGLPTAHPNDG